MSEDAGEKTDEIGAVSLLSGEAHDQGRRMGERDMGLDRRPSDEWGRCKRKGLNSEKTRRKKRSMLVRLPSSNWTTFLSLSLAIISRSMGCPSVVDLAG